MTDAASLRARDTGNDDAGRGDSPLSLEARCAPTKLPFLHPNACAPACCVPVVSHAERQGDGERPEDDKEREEC
eukprot:2141042-Pleurochrysis_carterae.AAC.2